MYSTHEFAHSLLVAIGNKAFEDQDMSVFPEGQYAQTCFATASLRAATLTNDFEHQRRGEVAIRDFTNVRGNTEGHLEFNSFAILEMLRDASYDKYDLPMDVDELREMVRYKASLLSSREGNNWVLLQAYCRTLYDYLFESWTNQIWTKAALSFSRRWESEGFISDRPRYPIGPKEIPTTYHAKSTMLLIRIAEILEEESLWQRSERYLRSLAEVSLASGETFYFGRSENTIFAYACAIDAFSRYCRYQSSTPSWAGQTLRKLVRYVLRTFPSSVIQCQPDAVAAESRIDTYIHDIVYCSYAAMILLGLPEIIIHQRNESTRGLAPTVSRLTTASGEQTEVAIATQGEYYDGKAGPDPRYTGMVPLAFNARESPLVPGMPANYREVGVLPYLPVIDGPGCQLIPVTWDSNIQKQGNEELVIKATGKLYNVNFENGSDEIDTAHRMKRLPEPLFTTVKKLGYLSGADLFLRKFELRPADTDFATVTRAINYSPDDDCLRIKTVIKSRDRTTIQPSSILVTNHADMDYHAPVLIEDEMTVQTHKGNGIWYFPTSTKTREFSSEIVLSPDI